MQAKMLKCVLFVLGLSVVVAGQQPRNPNNSDQSKLIALENAWNQAQLNRDAKALESLVADDFIYTDYDGTVLDRPAFLEDLKDPAYKTTLVANDDVKVHMYGNTAVVFGAYHVKGNYKGKPVEHFGRFTDTWIYLPRGWQCVASHTNLIKK